MLLKGVSLVFISEGLPKLQSLTSAKAASCLWLSTLTVSIHLSSRVTGTIKSKNNRIVELKWDPPPKKYLGLQVIENSSEQLKSEGFIKRLPGNLMKTKEELSHQAPRRAGSWAFLGTAAAGGCELLSVTDSQCQHCLVSVSPC